MVLLRSLFLATEYSAKSDIFWVGELGDVAVARMQRLAADDDSDHMAAAEMITLPILVSEPAPGIFAASGVGNTFVIRH